MVDFCQEAAEPEAKPLSGAQQQEAVSALRRKHRIHASGAPDPVTWPFR